MATRTTFPALTEGDGNTGAVRSPGVKAACLLMHEVLDERNRKRGPNYRPVSIPIGAWGRNFTIDLVKVKQYGNVRDKFGKINPHTIGRPAWEYLWTFARGKLGGECNALVVEELRRREEARRRIEEAAAAAKLGPAMIARAVNVAARMAANGHLYRYGQVRPFPVRSPGAILLPQFYGRWDCSSSVLGWYHAAGAPNPLRSDGKYDGYGHTGSLWAAGARVTAARAGDLVFYGDDYLLGPWRPQHVAMVIDSQRVATFGSNPPRIAPINYRSDIRGVRRYF